MYSNTSYGAPRPLPTQNGHQDVNNVNNLQRLRRTRSTNPFDYDPYDRSNDSPPPPVPPRPHELASASSPPPRPPPPPHHYQSAPNSSTHRSPPPPELRPFPRESDSDLSVPSSTSSSNRPSPSHVAAKPSAASYEYFNNPWDNPPRAHNVRQAQSGVQTGGLSIPQDLGMRQRAKSSVDLRAAASLRGAKQPEVSTFVAPTMSFPMPEIPTFGAALSGSGGGRYEDRAGALSQSQGHSPLGRATSAQATFGNTGKSLPPSPPRPQTRNSLPPLSEASPTTPKAPSDEDDGSKTHRTNSSSSGRSGSRGEFRFSPNLMKLQHMPSVTSIQSTSTTNSSVYKNVDEYEDGFASPTDQTVRAYRLYSILVR